MIIGIAGGTCTGKTTIAHMLAARLGAKVISLDDYFKLPFDIHPTYHFPDNDRLEAVDWERFIKDLRVARGTVIAEGFLLLTNAKVRKLCTRTFFIDVDIDELVKRRIAREPTTPPGYVRDVVQSRHTRLVAPTKKYASYQLDGRKSIAELSEEIFNTLW